MNNARIVMLSLLALLVMSAAARADGPPPITFINATYAGQPVNGTFYVAILTCTNATNATNVSISGFPAGQPRVIPSPERGCNWAVSEFCCATQCSDGQCAFYSYVPSDFKAEFYLPSINTTFITNEINASNFTTRYAAQLYPGGSATIAAISSPPLPPFIDNSTFFFFVSSLLLTLVVEEAVAFLYLNVAKIKKKARILMTIVFANIISVPLLWFGFVFLLGGLGFALGEIFAVLFEGYFVYLFNRKKMTLKSAMTMSLIMNVASMLIGLVLFSLY